MCIILYRAWDLTRYSLDAFVIKPSLFSFHILHLTHEYAEAQRGDLRRPWSHSSVMAGRGCDSRVSWVPRCPFLLVFQLGKCHLLNPLIKSPESRSQTALKRVTWGLGISITASHDSPLSRLTVAVAPPWSLCFGGLLSVSLPLGIRRLRCPQSSSPKARLVCSLGSYSPHSSAV